MIFDLNSLEITDRFISDISIEEIIKKDIFSFNDDRDYLKKILSLKKEEFIYFLDKYGGFVFHNLEENIYTKLVLSSSSVFDFAQKLSTFFDELQLKAFLSCFFISKEGISHFTKEVESDLNSLKDELSFTEFQSLYSYELKNLIDNYSIIKE